MVKYFYQGKLEPTDVQEFLAREKALHNARTRENSEQEIVFLGSSADAGIVENASVLIQDLKSQTGHLTIETAHAYQAVFLRLSEMRIIDNKSWQHRTIYRVSTLEVFDFCSMIFNAKYSCFRLLGCIDMFFTILKKQNQN